MADRAHGRSREPIAPMTIARMAAQADGALNRPA
jgi:hypothetical protein